MPGASPGARATTSSALPALTMIQPVHELLVAIRTHLPGHQSLIEKVLMQLHLLS
jgi:hypothetical protein